jgi:hypothetical protein
LNIPVASIGHCQTTVINHKLDVEDGSQVIETRERSFCGLDTAVKILEML